MRARSRLILACLAMPLIAGCAATAKESGRGSVDREILRAQRGGDGTLKELEAAREEVTKAQGANGDTDAGRRRRGSLWTDQQADMYLDNKARQVGDILRVNLNEDIEGTLSAESQATREASQTREVGAFAGLTDLRLRRFLVLVVVGRTPTFVAVAYAGTRLSDGVLGQFALVVTVLTLGSVAVYATRDRILARLDRI